MSNYYPSKFLANKGKMASIGNSKFTLPTAHQRKKESFPKLMETSVFYPALPARRNLLMSDMFSHTPIAKTKESDGKDKPEKGKMTLGVYGNCWHLDIFIR